MREIEWNKIKSAQPQLISYNQEIWIYRAKCKKFVIDRVCAWRKFKNTMIIADAHLNRRLKRKENKNEKDWWQKWHWRLGLVRFCLRFIPFCYIDSIEVWGFYWHFFFFLNLHPITNHVQNNSQYLGVVIPMHFD